MRRRCVPCLMLCVMSCMELLRFTMLRGHRHDSDSKMGVDMLGPCWLHHRSLLPATLDLATSAVVWADHEGRIQRALKTCCRHGKIDNPWRCTALLHDYRVVHLLVPDCMRRCCGLSCESATHTCRLCIAHTQEAWQCMSMSLAS
jgi:hypothetical protein